MNPSKKNWPISNKTLAYFKTEKICIKFIYLFFYLIINFIKLFSLQNKLFTTPKRKISINL